MLKQKNETVLSILKELRDILKSQKPQEAQDQVLDDRFTRLKDGWIRDARTSLEWGPSSEKEMNWEDAKKYCAEHGGRLPNVPELFSLVDRTKYEPATTIPGMKKSWYWTCEEVAWGSDAAWCVYFSHGSVFTFGKGHGCFVRPVRSSQ